MEAILKFKRSVLKRGLLAFALAFALSVPFASQAYAGTLFSYNGTGIGDKASVNQAYVNASTCYVNHSQTKNSPDANYSMTVSVQRQGDFWSWSTVGSKTFYNNVYNSVFSTYCNSGTYRLYFQSGTNGLKFDIYGTFYN